MLPSYYHNYNKQIAIKSKHSTVNNCFNDLTDKSPQLLGSVNQPATLMLAGLRECLKPQTVQETRGSSLTNKAENWDLDCVENTTAAQISSIIPAAVLQVNTDQYVATKIMYGTLNLQ